MILNGRTKSEFTIVERAMQTIEGFSAVFAGVMERPSFEVAQIIRLFGQQYMEQCQPNPFIVRTIDAVQKCRTTALGGHFVTAVVRSVSATTVAETVIALNARHRDRLSGLKTGSTTHLM